MSKKRKKFYINPFVLAIAITGITFLLAGAAVSCIQSYQNEKAASALSNIPVVHVNIPTECMPAVFVYITQPLKPTPEITKQFLDNGGSKIVVFDRS